MGVYEERQRLLRRMRDFFDGKKPDPELDEYELIDVFDFAGDNNELTLQEQISDYATRRYPDFEPLLVRRALMLLDKGDRELADKVMTRVNPDMVLAKLYHVLVDLDSGVPHQALLDTLQELLDAHPRLNDEEIIRLSDVAMDIDGGYQWLKEHLDDLRKKNDFTPTLIFEMAQNAKELGYLDDAVAFVEELTMIEPFEIEYWEMLAELYLGVDDLEKADNALEYALAIDPSSPRSRLIEAHLKIALHGADPVETLRTIDDIVFSDGLDHIPLNLAVSALATVDRQDLIMQYINRYIEKFPLSVPAIDLLLRYGTDPENIHDVLLNYWDNTADHTEFFWSAWARHHYAHNNFDGAVNLFRMFIEHNHLASPLLYLQSLYLSNRPADVVEYIVQEGLPEHRAEDTASTDTNNPDLSATLHRPLIILIFLMSLIRTNNHAAVMQIIEVELKNAADMYMSPGNLTVNTAVYGYMSLLRNIRTQLLAGAYPDEYDPLLMPQNLVKK